jgi:hypothetical protein
MLVEVPLMDQSRSKQILDALNHKLLDAFIEENNNSKASQKEPNYDRCIKVALKSLKAELQESSPTIPTIDVEICLTVDKYTD